MFIRQILVPVDFSLRSQAALAYAVGLARNTGASIEVLHVMPAPSAARLAFDAYAGRPLPEPSSGEVLHARDQLAALVGAVDHEGITLHQRVEVGDAAATIVRLATEEAHNLIVIGTHGRIGLSGLLLGSVAHTLMTSAPCPVVTLRAEAGVS